MLFMFSMTELSKEHAGRIAQDDFEDENTKQEDQERDLAPLGNMHNMHGE